MKMLLLGVAIGYVFHDTIDKLVKTTSDSIERNVDKADAKVDEKVTEATS